MKLKHLLFCLLGVLLVGGGSSRLMAMTPELDIEIINHSSRGLKNTQARFGDHVCAWGVLSKSATAGYLFFPHPITKEATLQWDEEGKSRVEKIDLSKTYPAGKPGCLTFTVYDDHVEAKFREKAQKG